MRDLRNLNITDASRGAAFTVKIVPKATKTEIVGIQEDGTIKIRLMSPPVEGQANEELIAFLAEFLHVNISDVEIVAGVDSRKKLISVLNVQAEDVDRLIKAQAGDTLLDDGDD
ncbi:MAG: YggU family protein [Anaerolineae bacterium]|nr:YggU family protein [Anaerolineae bacterium]